MDKIYILVPTRDKRSSLYTLMESWSKTTKGKSKLILVIDGDQESLYEDIIDNFDSFDIEYIIASRRPLAQKLNWAVDFIENEERWPSGFWMDDVKPIGYGFVGDDCVFTTPNWEEVVYQQLEANKGMCYCNDLLQGEALPNNIFIHSSLTGKLGFMCPLVLKHYYIDNYWRELGHLIHNIHYFPNEIIEHRHWSNKKVEKDELYKEAEKNYMKADKEAFEAYREEGKLLADAKKLGA